MPKTRTFRLAFGFEIDAGAGWRRAHSHRFTVGQPTTQLVRLAPEQPRGPYAHLRTAGRFALEGLFKRDPKPPKQQKQHSRRALTR